MTERMSLASGMPGFLLEARTLPTKADDVASLPRNMNVLRIDPDCMDAQIELAMLAGDNGSIEARRSAVLTNCPGTWVRLANSIEFDK